MLNLLKKIYYHPWTPRFFYTKNDGGKESGVKGYFLIEWKILFSIGLLHFKKGSRENCHSHAFNACTWWLSGHVTEETLAEKWNVEKSKYEELTKIYLDFNPALKPKITKRDRVHKVISHKNTWALTFRGPWSKMWFEVTPEGRKIHMIHGRKIVGVS